MMTTERQAEAHQLLRAGLPITLSAPGSKKPLGDGWDANQDGNAWQKKKWTHKEIDRAIKVRGDCNPGVLYGPRSGLIDIECDDDDQAAGEAAVLELFDGDVPLGPMFTSKRGPHRILRFDDSLDQIGKATIHYGPLEIKLGCNGKGAHSCWPPSTTGQKRREWVDGLNYSECDAPELPQSVKDKLFLRLLCETAAAGKDQGRNGTQRTQKSHEISVSTVSSVFPPPKHISPSPEIQKAVAATVPSTGGVRHRCIFNFARHLKAIPELVDADDETLRPYVEWWHEVALPVITTKPFEETWYDFRNAWDSVQFPAGEGRLDLMYAKAMSKPIPKCAEKYQQPQLRALVALCRELQRAAGKDPFFLAGRTAAEQIGVEHKVAWRWIKMLCMDRVLQLAERGTRHHASEYLYLGD
jgi:hypothetical protein